MPVHYMVSLGRISFHYNNYTGVLQCAIKN